MNNDIMQQQSSASYLRSPTYYYNLTAQTRPSLIGSTLTPKKELKAGDVIFSERERGEEGEYFGELTWTLVYS